MRSGLLVELGIDQGCWESGGRGGGAEGHSAWRCVLFFFSIHFDKKSVISYLSVFGQNSKFLCTILFNKTLPEEEILGRKSETAGSGVRLLL